MRQDANPQPQPRITLSDRARAQIQESHIERTIATAWDECKDHLPCDEAKAGYVVDSLKEAGYEIVRKEPAASPDDRWETGIRNIVHHLHGPRHTFEISDIVEEVRALVRLQRDSERTTFDYFDRKRAAKQPAGGKAS